MTKYLERTRLIPMKKYILGMLTVIVGIPIIKSLVELVQVTLEIPKGKLSKYVMAINKEIQELQDDPCEEKSPCIGFAIPNSEEEYYEDEE